MRGRSKHDFAFRRIWEANRREVESGCIEWQGALNAKGYGQVWYKGKVWTTHRLSYTLSKGGIPEGLFVLHTCDNRKCCNPAHLYAGTNSRNMKDMWRRIHKESSSNTEEHK